MSLLIRRLSSGAQVVTVGQSLETDVAQHAGEIQRVSELQATESDLAQAVKAIQIRAVGQALETDIAQQVKPLHVKSVNQATEVDTAQAVARKQLVAVLQAISSELAQSVAAKHVTSVGQSAESDTAQPAGERQLVSEQQAIESDTAQAVKSIQLVLVGQATEFDSTIGSGLSVVVLQAAEADAAQPVTAVSITRPQQLPPGLTRPRIKQQPEEKPRTVVTVAVGQAEEHNGASYCVPSKPITPDPLYVPPEFTSTPQKFQEPAFSFSSYAEPTEFEKPDVVKLLQLGVI